MATKRGLFIVIEGLDKAGKSTQCARLAANLENAGQKVCAMRFPDRTTPIGQMIDAYLKGSHELDDHVIHLLFSANRWEAVSKIESTLASGTTIVLDRYYFSGIVYTLAKRNPLVTFSWARAPDVGLPSPDICFFLDISAEDAAKRGGGYGEEKYETQERQKAVREEFYRLCEYEGGNNILKVDAGRSIEEVETTLLTTVKQKLQDSSNRPLGRVVTEPYS